MICMRDIGQCDSQKRMFTFLPTLCHTVSQQCKAKIALHYALHLPTSPYCSYFGCVFRQKCLLDSLIHSFLHFNRRMPSKGDDNEPCAVKCRKTLGTIVNYGGSFLAVGFAFVVFDIAYNSEPMKDPHGWIKDFTADIWFGPRTVNVFHLGIEELDMNCLTFSIHTPCYELAPPRPSSVSRWSSCCGMNSFDDYKNLKPNVTNYTAFGKRQYSFDLSELPAWLFVTSVAFRGSASCTPTLVAEWYLS